VLLIGAHNSFTAKVASPDNIKDKYLLRPMSRILFQRAEAIVSVSRGVSEDIARSLGLKEEKLHVIYNPVVSPLMIQMSKEVLQHPWLCHRLDRNYKTLLSVGRLVEQKGISLLIDAFAILPNREQYRLVIVGDGPLASHLKHKVQMHGIELLVDFIGYDSNPYRFMSRADLFVLASSWEGLANVLIEAMACGCPVVSTDCPYGPNEILEGGKYGQLVPVNDVKALSVAIFESLNCNSIEVSSNDLIRRANYFTHVRATNAYVDLIKKLVFQKSIAT
jgi:glycosyltransferase involved in cell wall biosynthesis